MAITIADAPLRTRVEASPRCEMQFRSVHGYRRAFICQGRGPAVLLIHGIGDNSSTWSQLIPALARDHLVVAPDLLGHGASDKPRADYAVGAYANGMRDLLSILGVDRATIVGHSMGGLVGMQLALEHPERLRKLVLVAPVASGGLPYPGLMAPVLAARRDAARPPWPPSGPP